MVKRVLFFISALFLFCYTTLFFLPKKELYYYAEKQLQKEGIVLSDETLHSKLFGLQLQHATLYYHDIMIGKMKEIELLSYIFYSQITLKKITLSSTVTPYIPSHIESVFFTYTLFEPKVVHIMIEGDFGKARIELDVVSKTIFVKVKPSSLMKKRYSATLSMLQRKKDGEYYYEQHF